MRNTEKTVWTKTNTPNLYRHQNRRYYARVFVGGKEIWKSLKTKLKTVAVERLQEHVVNARQQRASGATLAEGTLTFAQVVEQYRQNFRRDAEIADGTKAFREAGIKRVLKTWPGVGELATANPQSSRIVSATLASLFTA
jgi:hypothetical protein